MEWENSEWGDNEVDKVIQDGMYVDAKTSVESKALKRLIKNQTIHTLKAKALSDLCIKPKANEQYRIITEKQFNAYALILHAIETEIIKDLYLSIYRINEPTVKSIIQLIESGTIQNATFVISNFFNQTKKPERWAIELKDYSDTKENINHVYIHNHSKVVAMETTIGNYYVFEGSGNMSDNARIEQYIYENNQEVFDFHKHWMLDLITQKKHRE